MKNNKEIIMRFEAYSPYDVILDAAPNIANKYPLPDMLNRNTLFIRENPV